MQTQNQFYQSDKYKNLVDEQADFMENDSDLMQ